MPKQPVAAVILAAGMGTRMKSDLPKVLHEVGGKPLVGHALASVQGLDPQRIAVVVGPETDAVATAVAPVPTTVQVDRLGTADALKQARDLLAGFDDGTVVVSFGDSPFIRTETVARMVAAREDGAHVVVLGFEPEDPAAYGRLVTDADGGLAAIVEYKDADAATRAIRLCNSGVMAISAAHLFALVDRIGNDNAKGEYYLTDVVAVARGDGLTCSYILAEESELMGINSRIDLAAAEAFWQDRARRAAMDGGATLRDPSSTFFSWDTVLGRDVVVEPNVVFGPGVTVEDGVTIKAFSHFEGCILRKGSVVGPFARIRPGADIGEGAKIGNFVEVKNAVFAAGAKANHLSYIGDADVGAAANIGAGTITCNYDGYLKHRTKIGTEAFIGSNSSLVAPVSIGDRANVGAGSTITKDVAADALAVARGEQRILEGVAAKLRARLKAAKAAMKKS